MEKYEKNRSQIKHGDIILFRGNSSLSKSIQFFDNAYYNHIGVAFIALGRIFILDANAPGVHPDFLSYRISQYEDFCVLAPNKTDKEIEIALNKLMDKSEIGIKYNFLRLPKIAILKAFGLNIKKLDQRKRNICSQFVQQYTNLLGIKCYAMNDFITPEDFIRQNDPSESVILFDEH